MRLRSIAAYAAFLSASLAAHATPTTITFNNLKGPDNAPLTSYTESGYTVSNLSGTFYKATNNTNNFGNPEPDIYDVANSTFRVTDGGNLFSFSGLDLGFFNSGTISYVFTGLLNGKSIFSQSGDVSDSTSQTFVQLNNNTPLVQITALRVALDPNSTGGANVDNIRVSNSVTPEPSSLLLLGTGALGMIGAIKRRFV